ncbi:DUF370 domain-containing protein [Desulfobacterales bacterium HSG16]|nr:DUF370 domain-containing protein [Desulfobacterales bacterium HSG16]
MSNKDSNMVLMGQQPLLNVGFGSTVVAERVVAILPPGSSPMKRLKDEAKEHRKLVDATHGRKTRSVIVMDSNHIILSAVQAETMSLRFTALNESRHKEVLENRKTRE